MIDRTRQSSRATCGWPRNRSLRRDAVDSDARQRRGEQRPEGGHVGLRTTREVGSENEMRFDIADDSDFGKAVIHHAFPRAANVPSPLDKVTAGGRGFEARGVDRRAGHAALASQVLANRRVEQASGGKAGQESLRGFLQRRVMRDFFQPQCLDERWAIGEMRDDAPIVRLQEVLQHQAGKKLVLRELLRTTAMRIRRQRLLGRCQRRQNHRPRTLARRRRAFSTNARDVTV